MHGHCSGCEPSRRLSLTNIALNSIGPGLHYVYDRCLTHSTDSHCPRILYYLKFNHRDNFIPLPSMIVAERINFEGVGWRLGSTQLDAYTSHMMTHSCPWPQWLLHAYDYHEAGANRLGAPSLHQLQCPSKICDFHCVLLKCQHCFASHRLTSHARAEPIRTFTFALLNLALLRHIRTSHIRTSHIEFRPSHIRTSHIRTFHIRTSHIRTFGIAAFQIALWRLTEMCFVDGHRDHAP